MSIPQNTRIAKLQTQVDNLSYMASRVSKTAVYRRFSTESELKNLAFSPTGFDQSQANGLSQISEGWSGIDEARIDSV